MLRLTMIVAVLSSGLAAQPGGFAVLESLYDPASAKPAATFDVDGDGDLDVVDYRGGVHLNDGNARFTPPPYPGPSTPNSHVLYARPIPLVDDFDADGDLDVLMPTTTHIERWTNIGGTMTGFLPYGPAPTARPHAIVGADIDGDGDTDAIVIQHMLFSPGSAGPAPLMVWRNNGGTFTDVTTTSIPVWATGRDQVLMADIDNDGDLDMFVVNSGNPVPTTLLFNDGTGVFTAAVVSPGNVSTPTPPRVAVGDVTGDGLPDVVSADGESAVGISIEVNSGGGNFAPPITFTTSIALRQARPFTRDLDGDGTDEIFVPTTNAGLRVYPASVAGIIGLTQVVPTVGPLFIDGDFDGDGDLDFLMHNAAFDLAAASPCQLLFSIANGQLVPADGSHRGPGRSYSSSPAFVDIDADGDLDLVDYDGQLHFHVNDGRGTLTWDPGLGAVTGVTYSVNNSQGFEPLDLDGDGDLDFVIAGADASFGAAPFLRSLINGGATWSPGPAIPAQPTRPHTRLAVGDFNGDGMDDFVVAPPLTFFTSSASGPLDVYLATGSGNFAAPISLTPGTDIADVAVADIDGDGNLDVVQADAAGPSIIFLGDGGGGFTSPFAALPSARTVDVADVDLDGILDLFLGAVVRRHDGAGSFPYYATLGTAYATDRLVFDVNDDGFPDLTGSGGYWQNAGSGYWPFVQVPGSSRAAGDLDRDGDVDLWTSYPNSSIVIQNLTRQLASRGPTRPGRPAGFDLFGEPSATWQLWVAPTAGSLQLPEGLIRINPLTAIPFATGTFPPSGYSPFIVNVPANPALVGYSLHWQAVVYEAAGPKLTTVEVTPIALY